jgi:prolyl oligopeptidase
MPKLMAPPPYSLVEPVTDILHGVPVVDPYRWLEEQNSPRTRRWLEEQGAYTRAYLDALPGRNSTRKRVEELLAVEAISEPWKVGGRYFYLRRRASSEQPAIIMREGDSGEEVVLVDPTKRDPTGATAVGILNISSDGGLLAYIVRTAGTDSCAVEFFDVDRQQTLQDQLPHGFCRGLVFTPDDKGFYYSHEVVGATPPSCRAVFRHIFGTDSQQSTEIFFGGDDPNLRLILLASPSGRKLGYCKLFRTDPKRIDFLIQDIASGTPPRLIVEQMQGIFAPFLLEDGLLALTDWQAPNGRVVKIDLDCPEARNWRDLVPESASRIRSIAVVGESIFVTSVKDLATHLEVFDFSARKLRVISLPSLGTASLFPSRRDSDTIFLRFTAFAQPPSILSHQVGTGEQEPWAHSQVQFDPSSIEIHQIGYLSKDRVKIPMSLVFQKGRRTAGTFPTFLTGYGGFGNSITPQFAAYATYLVERGCLFAVANLRGGAEFGEAWHLAAKRHKRQTAIDDFISAAEWLLAEGYAQPDRLAIGGGSNAGLLVGAALTQRPDLFCAVVCLGPLLDMVRYHLFDSAGKWVDEYGSAEIESDFQNLLRYSPYHGVKEGVAYPAVMLLSGDADTRCNPMHARKMTARLQAATSSGHPVLLDYQPAWGHTPVQPLTRRVEALTDRLAFLCHELKLSA